MNERPASRLVELDCSGCGCEPRADHKWELREELFKLVRQKPRYGYRRLHVTKVWANRHAGAQLIDKAGL